MLYFAKLLEDKGVKAVVVSPEELTISDQTNDLYYKDMKIDLIYNRMTDFRLEDPFHAHIRRATVAGSVALTPHPAGTLSIPLFPPDCIINFNYSYIVYVRAGDKRNLLKMKHAVIPDTHLLKEKTIEEWCKVHNVS